MCILDVPPAERTQNRRTESFCLLREGQAIGYGRPPSRKERDLQITPNDRMSRVTASGKARDMRGSADGGDYAHRTGDSNLSDNFV